MGTTNNNQGKITYKKLFCLFIAGSILGVLTEGAFCLVTKGQWESHVLTLVGQFNALYGVGAVLFYCVIAILYKRKTVTKTVAITVIATVLELICGLILADGIGMKAWDYSETFLNYRGIICLPFALVWGLAGFAFCLCFDKIERALSKLQSRKWNAACVVLSVFMALNLALTAVSINRWSKRHYGVAADTRIGSFIDSIAPDEWMQKRFVEWSFLDNNTDNK